MRTTRVVALALAWASWLAACGNVESDPPGADPASSPAATGPAEAPLAHFVGSLGDGRAIIHAGSPQWRRVQPGDLEEIARARAARPAPLGAARPLRATPPGMTARALARAAALPAGGVIDVSIELAEPGFDLRRLRGQSDDARQGLISERRQGLAASQGSLEARLALQGGRVIGRNWLVNVVDAEVPAGLVPEIATWPGVVAVSTPEPFRDLSHLGWNGRQIRTGVLTQAFIDAGHDANHNNRVDAATPVRIALIEAETLPLRNHVGWLDSAGGSSRLKKVYQCNPTCATTTAGAPALTHGTQTMWLAGGSIEQGQDANFPGSGTAAQRDRSGIAKEAFLYYYRAPATNGVKNAIDRAVADGADIINMSIGLSVTCDGDITTLDFSGINAALRGALNAGALPVVGAGNEFHSAPNCSITYPAWRQEVLSVANVDTRNSNLDMNTTMLHLSSPRGGAELQISGATTRRPFSGIGLAAPGTISQFFSGEPASYSLGASDDDFGTSYSAPIVSGTAALLRDALAEFGFPANDPRLLLVNLLLLGDTWDEDANVDLRSGISEVTGYGRLHAHFPDVANMNGPGTGPVGWGTHRAPMVTGDVLTWGVGDGGPMSSLVRQWKWAVTWTDTSLAAASDIIITVRDACNGNRPVATDTSFDFRKRIHLRPPEIAGKCLVMEVMALKTPPGGTLVYHADYFHSSRETDSLH